MKVPSGAFNIEVKNEKKFKTLEKEKTDALEMAAQAHAKGKEEEKINEAVVLL